MPKHSPGPWDYRSHLGWVIAASGMGVADYVDDDNGPLIAAAPEMLQLLRDATACEGRDELAVVLGAARSLIARLDNG